MHISTNEQEGIQHTSLILLLAVAVQQHKLHLNKERWMHSETTEQEGTVHQCYLPLGCSCSAAQTSPK
jgi:hypothetical protein